jgi:hypothetical protein
MLRLSLCLVAGLAIACSNKAPEPKGEASPAVGAPAVGAPGAPEAAKGPAGPKAAGKGYTVEVTAPDGAVNAEHAARVTLLPTKGYHVNKEFPTSLKVTVPAGVSCANAEQTGDAATKLEEAEALFDVKCTATDAGEKKFEAKFSFAVCEGEKACYPYTEKLAWNVPIK